MESSEIFGRLFNNQVTDSLNTLFARISEFKVLIWFTIRSFFAWGLSHDTNEIDNNIRINLIENSLVNKIQILS